MHIFIHFHQSQQFPRRNQAKITYTGKRFSRHPEAHVLKTDYRFEYESIKFATIVFATCPAISGIFLSYIFKFCHYVIGKIPPPDKVQSTNFTGTGCFCHLTFYRIVPAANVQLLLATKSVNKFTGHLGERSVTHIIPVANSFINSKEFEALIFNKRVNLNR